MRMRLFSAACLLALASPAYAQVQPGGTVSDQFERPRLPLSEPIAPYRIERPATGESTDAVRFPVRRIVIEGAHSIAPEELDRLTADLQGRQASLGDLARLADRITAVYAARGYALSFALVPEQSVEDGVVRIRVVEGSVDAIEVQFREPAPAWNRARIEAAVRRRLRGLVASGPVRSADLDRAVRGIDDLAGIDVSVIVRPSTTTEGAARLTVILGVRPLEALLGADNRLRSEFGREEFYATFALNSSLLVGDRLELSTRRSFERDAFTYASIGYEAPLGDSLARVHADYSRAETAARRGLLGLLEYRGREEAFRIGLSHPLIRGRARSLFVTAELAGVDTRTSLFGVEIVRENVRTASLGLAYDWAGTDGSLSLLSLTVVQGLDGLGASDAANPLRSRAQGRPDGRYALIRYYREQALPQGVRLRLDNHAQFLLSSKALPAASECTFGGPAIGRAYDAGVLSGDECWRASAELARPFNVLGQGVEPYLFLDFAMVRQQGPLEAGESRRREAAAYGAGIRLFSRHGFTADLQASMPAERLVAGDGGPRLFFQLTYRR